MQSWVYQGINEEQQEQFHLPTWLLVTTAASLPARERESRCHSAELAYVLYQRRLTVVASALTSTYQHTSWQQQQSTVAAANQTYFSSKKGS